ncbi:MAG: isochorismatase family cysteine hydrolase [Anaerolineae bacterium]|nr:isochorismatase family cysteine hydrolase [Anaerolineae bacterium]
MSVALILIDVINQFFDLRGENYHSSYEEVFRAVQELIRAARQGKRLVIHAREWHRPGHTGDFEWRKLPPHALAGSFQAEFPAGLPMDEEDLIVHKRRYSAFFATDLDLLLRERRIGTLVLAGVKTHVCVRATAQDAFALGYEVLVVREAVGSNHPHLHAASLEDIERYMGRVVGLHEAVGLLQG